ncbi:hypothetical protein CYMTET_32078, partial [Cymbomonas tetramitiformis]
GKCPARTRLEIFMVEGNQRSRLPTVQKWKDAGGVLIIGYEAFRNMCTKGCGGRDMAEADLSEVQSLLQDPGADLLVCDEAHTIKNDKTSVTTEIKKAKTRRRIALTGSPLQNNLTEYYHMVDFVRPNILGNTKQFNNRFVNPIKNGQLADSKKEDVQTMKKRTLMLHKKLARIVQRMGPEVLRADLPAKREFVIHVRLSRLQRSLYRYWLENIHGHDKGHFDAFHTLRKIWNHPDSLFASKCGKDDEDDLAAPRQSAELDSDEDAAGNAHNAGKPSGPSCCTGFALNPHISCQLKFD